nr:DUF4166 domain-containing protein [Salinibacterium sp. ZJ450]
MLQLRFGVGLDAGYAAIGRGTMAQIRRGPWWTIPFLRIGKIRNILIPISARTCRSRSRTIPTSTHSVVRPSRSCVNTGFATDRAGSTQPWS